MTPPLSFSRLLFAWMFLSTFLTNQIAIPSGLPTQSQKIENKSAGDDTTQKVIKAMLSMQRRAWEQGVAAQALLELGETELVILLAKDAVVNQWKDGRLA